MSPPIGKRVQVESPRYREFLSSSEEVVKKQERMKELRMEDLTAARMGKPLPSSKPEPSPKPPLPQPSLITPDDSGMDEESVHEYAEFDADDDDEKDSKQELFKSQAKSKSKVAKAKTENKPKKREKEKKKEDKVSKASIRAQQKADKVAQKARQIAMLASSAEVCRTRNGLETGNILA